MYLRLSCQAVLTGKVAKCHPAVTVSDVNSFFSENSCTHAIHVIGITYSSNVSREWQFVTVKIEGPFVGNTVHITLRANSIHSCTFSPDTPFYNGSPHGCEDFVFVCGRLGYDSSTLPMCPDENEVYIEGQIQCSGVTV